jgi:hypothetical protein
VLICSNVLFTAVEKRNKSTLKKLKQHVRGDYLLNRNLMKVTRPAFYARVHFYNWHQPVSLDTSSSEQFAHTVNDNG